VALVASFGLGLTRTQGSPTTCRGERGVLARSPHSSRLSYCSDVSDTTAVRREKLLLLEGGSGAAREGEGGGRDAAESEADGDLPEPLGGLLVHLDNENGEVVDKVKL